MIHVKIGLSNSFVGLLAGVTMFETSVAGLGGCPFALCSAGNTGTEDMVNMFSSIGLDTNVELSFYMEAARVVQNRVQPNSTSRFDKPSCHGLPVSKPLAGHLQPLLIVMIREVGRGPCRIFCIFVDTFWGSWSYMQISRGIQLRLAGKFSPTAINKAVQRAAAFRGLTGYDVGFPQFCGPQWSQVTMS